MARMFATSAWFIGIMAAAYVASGGLKACAWADFIQGSALIFGGGVIMYFALHQLGETPLANLASSAPVPDGLTDADGGVAKFTALMKLMIPFIIVMLGMIAFTRLGNHGESDAGMANGISFEPGNRMNNLIGRNISALIPEHPTHEPSLNSNAEKR